MAVARVQYPTPYASSAKATAHTLAWTSTTTAGSLLLACVGWNEEASTVTATVTGGSGGWTAVTGTPVERFTAGSGQLKGAIYYKQNAAAQSGNVTLTLSASHHATIHLVEYSGVALSGGPDQVATANANGTALASGTTGTLAAANELRSAFLVCKNTNAQTTPTNGFTQVGETGQSSGGGAGERSGYYEHIAAATTADSTGATVSAAVDYVGMIATWQAATAGALVQLTSTGATRGPQMFPLGPPDMSGATTITDTTPDAVFTPTHPGDPVGSGLRSGVDYIINCPAVRSRRMMISGGRNVYVPQYLMKFAAATPLSQAIDGWMLGMQGGDPSGIIHFETVHLDNNRQQCDAFKTFKVGGGLSSPTGGFARTVQIRNCVVEKLVGQSSQVHADLFQTSGGCGDIWVEDFTGSTEYDGFMFQQEANIENQTVAFTVSGAVVSGANYVYTAAGHTYSVGDPVVVWNMSPNAYNGGYTILSATSTTFTCKKGDSSPGASTAGGNCAKMFFAYLVGSINFNRVNTKGFTNELTSSASNQGIRFGARTTPSANAGNPGATIGSPPMPANTHINEDQTPLNIDQWAGTLYATNWFGAPDAGTIANWVEPDSNTSNYSGARPTQHAATGGQPAYASWDSHPNVVAGTKFQQGPPTGGDFVSVNTSGIPVPRVPNTGGSGVSLKIATADAAVSVGAAGNFPDVYDTFTRSVGAGDLGAADYGGTYTLTGTAADFSVNGSQAVIAITAANQTKRAILANAMMLNQYATATMQTDTFPAGSYTAFDVYVRYVDANNWYRARAILNPSGTIQLRWDKSIGGAVTTITPAATTPLTVQTATDYTILAQAVGVSPTVLNAYIWDASAPPPLPVPYQAHAIETSSPQGLLTSLTLTTSPTLVTNAVTGSSVLQVASAAGFGAALNSASTATATKVSCTYWDAWQTRLTSSTAVTVAIPAARVQVVPFSVPTVTGTKHRHTPRS